MQTTGELEEYSIDFRTNTAELLLKIDNPDMNILENLRNEQISLELKKYRKKRSLDANSLFWVLLQRYSLEKGVNYIDEYKERVRILGIFRQFKIMTEQVKTFETMWEKQGIAWFTEIVDTEYIQDQEFKLINAYYGSSSYNTKQMSKLLNSLVQDCIEVGIETKTREEIDSLLKEWK